MTSSEFPRIDALFSSDEKQAVRGYPSKDRRHPTKRLLFPEDRDRQVATNTDIALAFVTRTHQDWLQIVKPRLLVNPDFSESSATWGEIRALGYLLNANIDVSFPEVKKDQKRPEFILDFDGKKVIVEVKSEQMNAGEARELEEFHKATETPSKQGFTSNIKVITPCGRPGENENVTINAIHKLAQIKSNETQVSETIPSILWVDLQDEAWGLVMNPDSTFPIRSWKGAFCSGEFWYAMYGWKGAPVYESIYEIIEMPHDGRFNQKTRFDAVVFSLERSVFMLENHNSSKPLPVEAIQAFLRLPWFRFEHCHLNWPANNLKSRIACEKDRILSLKNNIEYIRYIDANKKKTYPDAE